MSFPEPRQAKAQLRARYRALRRSVPDETRQRYDQAINAAIRGIAADRNAARVTGYLAFDGEPDIAPALGRLNRAGVDVHLPVIGPKMQHDALSFRRWPAAEGNTGSGELRRNSFGIQEPVVGETCAVADLDIVFLPLVAWDERGGRLGMGAGYYDRALEHVATADRPLRIGIAYGVQQADELPMTDTDVRLHGVLTESGLFTCIA